MENKIILYGLGGLIIGVLLTVFVASSSVNSNNTGMMRMMGMSIRNELMNNEPQQERRINMKIGMGSSMDEMMSFLEGKTGDEFDQAFLEAMIAHHQGAIEMAKVAKVSAMHEEIKSMTDDIIAAQTKEVEMMKDWQSQWGY